MHEEVQTIEQETLQALRLRPSASPEPPGMGTAPLVADARLLSVGVHPLPYTELLARQRSQC